MTARTLQDMALALFVAAVGIGFAHAALITALALPETLARAQAEGCMTCAAR